MAAADKARDALAHAHRSARDLAQAKGREATKRLMAKAARELEVRIAAADLGPGADSFTARQLRATLTQVQAVQRQLGAALKKSIVDLSADAADAGVEDTARYLRAVDKQFRGTGTQPLALDEARMLEKAHLGVEASILRRLGSSGTGVPGALAGEHRAKQGVLARYGMAVIDDFEQTLQHGLVTRKSWGDMRADITAKSPFLQGKPAFWGERIVRTEVMGAYAKAGWEATRAADDELGDMVKIVAATFDDRTGADSFAVHGQIRRVDEAFEWWGGLYQHPPNRPNDREVVVPHRVSWPIPPYLAWKSPSDIAARWKLEKRKGSPPPRPTMTTVPLDRFGKEQPKREREGVKDASEGGDEGKRSDEGGGDA